MTSDCRRDVIVAAVARQIGVEGDIERLLGRVIEGLATTGASGAVRASLDGLRQTAAEHRAALAQYHDSLSGNATAGSGGGLPPTTATPDDDTTTTIIENAQAVLARAITGYGVLAALAFRLYEPPLRELAPRHLRAYAAASHNLYQLLADAVAEHLLDHGLGCHCTCPMCAIGACGCVTVTTRHINRCCRETIPSDDLDGLVLQQPRPSTQFAEAGLTYGDRLLAIDGQPIRSLNDLMDGIRNHPIGEGVRLRIQRGTADPQDILVRHVSDY